MKLCSVVKGNEQDQNHEEGVTEIAYAALCSIEH